MKHFALLTAFLAVLFIISCKPAEPKEEAMEPIPAANFDAVIVMHPVNDYAMWRPHYDAHDSVRQAYGLSTIAVGRGTENPNMILVGLRAADINKAKEFVAMPELKTVMDSAGVSGPPTIHYMHSVRFDSSMTNKDRVFVAAKVKDYDAWLKVFDNEGRKTRMEHGLVDRAIARGTDDPNMVYIVLGVTDMEKAKARLSSEELKGLMMESGVEGQPEMFWYTIVD